MIGPRYAHRADIVYILRNVTNAVELRLLVGDEQKLPGFDSVLPEFLFVDFPLNVILQNYIMNSMCVERGNSILHRAAAYPPRSAGTSIQATQS